MYNFSGGDPYGYSLEDEDEEEEEEPAWAAKAPKMAGQGLGLGKGKSFSGGMGYSQTSQQQQMMSKTGGSFYGQQNQQQQMQLQIQQQMQYQMQQQMQQQQMMQQMQQQQMYQGYSQGPQNGFQVQGGAQKQMGKSVEKNPPAKQVAQQKQPEKKKGAKDFVAKRIGVKFDPPTIILEYLAPQTGKLYHHKMKIKKLQPDSLTSDAIEYIKKKHFTFFLNDQITDKQLENLINKMKLKLKQNLTATSKTPVSNSKPTGKPTTTAKPTAPVVAQKPNPMNFPMKQTSSFSKGAVQQMQPVQLDSEDDYDEEYMEGVDEIEDIDYDNFNLNKLSTEELKKHKDRMEVGFKKNVLKPGDPGFKYDSRQDFDPQESNDWDMDD